MDLFDTNIKAELRPLADRMRVESLDDFIGQSHIVGEGSLLRRAIQADRLGSCIFYGPPGTGKTTLANIIAKTTGAHYEKLNAVSSGVSESRQIISAAKDRLKMYNKQTYLLLDECHRWNKAQSDSVLEAIEKGHIIFIGTTTENPYVSLTSAIISRCRVFEFHKLSYEDILQALKRALSDKKNGLGNYNTDVAAQALEHFAFVSDGDLRVAYNALELAVITTKPINNVITIDIGIAENTVMRKALSVNRDMYYDMLSAFCKSLRGSDADAALYWAERLISAGIDPLVIARRLIVHSAEDVGMADPHALTIAVSALTALKNIGLPEGRIPLAEAIIYVAEASKSNSVVRALGEANEAVTLTKDDNVPPALYDTNYKKIKKTGYKYPHDYGGYVEQQYLPESLKDREFYTPSENGYEATLIRAKKIRKNKG
ncbi:MAG: replication-associated recombination protein A [Christensenellales bacterium]|jgi:putative ATPase